MCYVEVVESYVNLYYYGSGLVKGPYYDLTHV